MDLQTQKIMFSSKSDEWATPDWMFDLLDKEFKFSLDACATDKNSKCVRYFDMESDGLNNSWGNFRSVFVNPPYSDIKKWIEKCYLESLNNSVKWKISYI